MTKTTVKLVHAEPPVKRGNKVGRWEAEAEALKAEPGVWMIIESERTNNGLANNVKAGILQAFRPRGAFEAEWSQNEPPYPAPGVPTYTTYARYVGTPDA